MKNLEDIIKKIEDFMNTKEDLREDAIRISRDITITCRRVIQLINRRSYNEVDKLLEKAENLVKDLNELTSKHPDILYTGFVENACQEYAEATCLYSITNDKDLPDPDRLGVSYTSYLLGLCDVIGEIRRLILDDILRGDHSRVDKQLDYMDRIYYAIMRFDHPSGLIPIKRKQDMVRNIIERTRGDLVVVSSERNIINKTDEFYTLIGKISKNTVKQKDKDENGIDVDKIW
ncbi:MAG: RNA-binding protein [Candidatus Thermoplasmatota archaeon]